MSKEKIEDLSWLEDFHKIAKITSDPNFDSDVEAAQNSLVKTILKALKEDSDETVCIQRKSLHRVFRDEEFLSLVIGKTLNDVIDAAIERNAEPPVKQFRLTEDELIIANSPELILALEKLVG